MGRFCHGAAFAPGDHLDAAGMQPLSGQLIKIRVPMPGARRRMEGLNRLGIALAKGLTQRAEALRSCRSELRPTVASALAALLRFDRPEPGCSQNRVACVPRK